ncbi:PmoA family protein [Adhaeribacter aquaticus]|uniref:DUF6807 domain-containing protein n=1 Tax=Adhaeribacter aquaticus TaxID=299567 RepID=UPI0004016315|nr:PmoA family protein [Adhaeribacter aquaticus]
MQKIKAYRVCCSIVLALAGILVLNRPVNSFNLPKPGSGGGKVKRGEYKIVSSKGGVLFKSKYTWQKTDTSTALLYADKIVWKLNHNKKFDKPYFYPVRVAGQEADLAALSPSDHPWHRGLWFTWKLINGVNYWEEDTKTRLSAGRTRINKVAAQLNKDFSAKILLELNYSPAGKPAVLQENRVITISAPDENGNYYIDWDLKFKASNQSVVFDRTPPESQGGPVYGGYAGLSLRASQKLTQPQYLSATGWTNNEKLVGYGQRAQWMDLSGVIDPATQARAGLTMFNHPSNPNSPVPWYVYEEDKFSFFNAALLFDKPLNLKTGSALTLNYRVLVHQDIPDKAFFDNEYKKYLKQ